MERLIKVRVEFFFQIKGAINSGRNTMVNNKLNFEPWIGRNYSESAERLLLFGESHYINEGENDDHNFTTEVIKNHLAKEEMRTPFFETIDLLFTNDAEQKEFWDRIAFANLIQKGFATALDQPSLEDIATVAPSFYTLLNLLQPTKVVVLSKRMWNYWLPEGNGRQVGSIVEGKLKVDVWKYEYDGGFCLAVGIKHPSRIWGNKQIQERKSLLNTFSNKTTNQVTTDK
ncbi:MAG: hypothetical protein EOP48_03710 [Sphingobacteriales bacterium]|nr:MAG: hypothetical protein EOP48_03710 [Sphingobacteriales bacterium]